MPKKPIKTNVTKAKAESATKKPAAKTETVKEAAPKKRVTKKLTPKEAATKKGEPYITVLSIDLAKDNPGNGSFELDWNDVFIKDLRAAGYPGKTDEDVVDMWFRNICRNVLAETYEQDAAQKDNVRYINRIVGANGRTEVS